MSRFFGSLCI